MKYEGILHVGSDNYISRLDFAYQVAEVFLFDKALITSISTKELSEKNSSYIAKRPMDSSLNITKVENEINISMVSTLFSLQKIKQNLC